MKLIKNNLAGLVILLIFAVGITSRTTWYGDLKLSIANAETDSYMSSARNSIFSWNIFAGQRLFTTNLVYKFANDPTQCPITSYGKPGIGEEDDREIQACFDKVALLQNYLAVFGWCFLGWMAASKVNNPLLKIFAATAIMLFGFTPQIAEWDSVLSPESLSMSLFAITLGVGLELVFRAAKSDTPLSSGMEKFLLVLFLVLFLLWIFVRDVHLYAIPITLLMIAPLFLFKKFRVSKPLLVTTGFLIFIFAIGYLSARDSLRATRFPLMNSLDVYIWPYPARVEFFKKFGMPEKDAPSYFNSPKYQAWADENASKAYAAFLVTHPGFVVTTLWENMEMLNGEYAQPYFLTDEVRNRDFMFVLGEMVNPESGTVYLISLLLLMLSIFLLAFNRDITLSTWAWLTLWAYGIAAATLFISYFGDTAGLRRHIMPSVEYFRLFLWVFLIPLLDRSLVRENN